MLLGVRKDPEKGKVKDVAVSDFLYRVLLPRHLKWRGAPNLRHLVCCIRRIQKLGLYTRCFLLIVVAFILLSVYHFCPVQISSGWILPDTCVADDCRIMDPLPYSKLSPNLLCVLIHASAGKRERRDVIRKTWASKLNNRPNSPIQYRFVIGGKKVSSSVMDEVMKEASEHEDMLVFPTVTDSIYSLTNRTLLSFKYAHEAFNYKYFLKCDDDTFVDLARMATELQKRKSDAPFLWGFIVGASGPKTFGRYAESKWYFCNFYTPYALGGGYVLSREVTGILAANAEHLIRYICEDVSMGTWLAPYNIERKHDARFNTNTPSRGCKDPFLISHKVSPEWMISLQESMDFEGRMCSWRTYSFGLSGFIYNWEAPPSSCCRRNSYVP